MTDLGYQLRQAKRKLSNDVLYVLRRWEAEHCIKVTSLDIVHTQAIGERSTIVHVEPRLDVEDLG